jgi:hypothetical protein
MESAVEKMLVECDNDQEALGWRIAGVLEFLTLRAVADKPFFIFTDNEDAVTIVAAGDAVAEIRDRLDGMDIKRWEDPLEIDDEVDFVANADPGDEQDEPATEQE